MPGDFRLGRSELEKGMHFRVWAPEKKTVKLVINPQSEDIDPLHWPIEIELQNEGNGYFSVMFQNAWREPCTAICWMMTRNRILILPHVFSPRARTGHRK